MAGPDDPRREVENYPDGNDPTITHDVRGPFLERFHAAGGVAELGLPVAGEQEVVAEPLKAYGDLMMPFQQGSIYVHSATGESAVHGYGWFAFTPLKDAEGNPRQ